MMGFPLSFEPGMKVEYSSLSFHGRSRCRRSCYRASFQQLSADFFSKHDLSGFSLDDPYNIVPNRVRDIWLIGIANGIHAVGRWRVNT